jgi:hypothetical protein
VLEVGLDLLAVVEVIGEGGVYVGEAGVIGGPSTAAF